MYQVPTVPITKRTDLTWKLYLFITTPSNTCFGWLTHKLEHVWKNDPWMFNSLNSTRIFLPFGIFLKIVINSDTSILLVLVKIARHYFTLFWQGQYNITYYWIYFFNFLLRIKNLRKHRKPKSISFTYLVAASIFQFEWKILFYSFVK